LLIELCFIIDFPGCSFFKRAVMRLKNHHSEDWTVPLRIRSNHTLIVQIILYWKIHAALFHQLWWLINNYWMRLSMISRIIQTEVNVICRSEAEADNIDRGLNNSWCHAKAESNNCFIIHLKTSETYKTIKQSLVMFQVYLF
jgi:hypothetical protein